jgi:hypothetical protein
MMIHGRAVPGRPGDYVAQCPVCKGECLREVHFEGVAAKALVCGPCDLVHLVRNPHSQPTWVLWQTAEATGALALPLCTVTHVLPSTAKQWSDGTPLLPLPAVGDPDDGCSTFAMASLKTPGTALQASPTTHAVPGPLRRSHFEHGSVFVQLDDSAQWHELLVFRQSGVSLKDQVTKVAFCARPAVPGHGVVFKLVSSSVLGTDTTSCPPGTPIAVPLREWWDFVEDIDWAMCTNCSTGFEIDCGSLEGSYSSHLLLVCYHCGARMLFDVPGDDEEARYRAGEDGDDEGTWARFQVRVAGPDTVFLPAKTVAYVTSEDWEECEPFGAPCGITDPCARGFLACNSTIVNMPAAPYPAGIDLQHDGTDITVIFDDGTMGCYGGD